ncbi:ATP phosphoribosyltransferase [Dehalococcoides mccartyi]|uniref:ATP phosphoribosyltransferase n=1 Tax=Dehalococcoides mccartyi TaxID=61435 RepID=UPI0002B77039|nr:ATP phosphoribosyltransferase [Dehalococcoides mccartyi]AGG07856.1 ATP phosphoribosyltransferase catalytic subunit [Dehalococcoides mccartyi BTF08]KSV17056.1 ATP phosphoribosyltransferase [Dehalococcoides mccartyi]
MLRVALPKGRLLGDTKTLLEKSQWGLDGYMDKAKIYCFKSVSNPKMSAKIFHEKDIPIQLAIGNYDLGVCGADWLTELTSRYPSSNIIKLKNLGYGHGALYAATAINSRYDSLAALSACTTRIRIASEYPNIAEAFAMQLRLKNFSIFPLWGSAEAYPPDTAEVVILPRKSEADLAKKNLRSIAKVLDFKAYLIANSQSLEEKDLSGAISSVMANISQYIEPKAEDIKIEPLNACQPSFLDMPDDTVRLALPDGHQQPHVRKILDAAGISIEDYPSASGNHRPVFGINGIAVKVIRPQDMPIQVANGNFDLAITGRDWLTDHLYQFPTSPVKELLDLKYGWVKLVAVVHNDVPVANLEELKNYCGNREMRIASEYTNISDFYARSNHLGHYRIVPTWGATEAFLPEDADMLVENTETGGTIARHNLKIIDTLFESTACVIANYQSVVSAAKSERINKVINMLKKALEA